LLRDDELADRIEDDWESAGLEERRVEMLRYAVKLTSSPSEVTDEDVAALRAAGFSDVDVLHLAEVVAYYAYANRIADGLGIALEDWIPED
jgi:uncharacterized peroxidase-related enzyme